MTTYLFFYRIYYYNISFLPGISLEELTLNINKQFENKNGLCRILARLTRKEKEAFNLNIFYYQLKFSCLNACLKSNLGQGFIFVNLMKPKCLNTTKKAKQFTKSLVNRNGYPKCLISTNPFVTR